MIAYVLIAVGVSVAVALAVGAGYVLFALCDLALHVFGDGE